MEELARKLRYFATEIKGAGVVVPKLTPEQEDAKAKAVVIDEMESQLDDLEHDLRDVSRTYATLNRDAAELIELKLVLENTADIFVKDAPAAHDALRSDEESRHRAAERKGERASLLSTPGGAIELDPTVLGGGGGGNNAGAAVQLGFVAGVIVREKMQAFERLLWRATRGNVFVRHVELGEPIADPVSGVEVAKNVVVVFFQGAQAEAKIKRVCDSRGVHLYPCPDNAEDRAALLRQVDERLKEMRDVLDKSSSHRNQLLNNLAAQLPVWRAKVAREKAIADTMNLFNYNVGRKCLVAVGWCPVERTDDVRAALRRGSDRSNALTQSVLSIVKTNQTPPTYFALNKYVSAFHGIVEAYGVASYKEINPTPLTVVTFPFLFGIMFGDFGHGLLMMLFSLGLIAIERRVDERALDEMGGMIFGARYMLLGMGFFSAYIGLLYNEAFAVGLDFMGGSRWHTSNWPPEVADSLQWCENDGVYPFGVDPSWKGTSNEITFYNSLKMKVSIIFGVIHMAIGIVFSMLNAYHFKKWYDLFFVSLPSLIFFLSMFGYLAFLIVFKWVAVFSMMPNLPKIMNIMIDMFLAPFSCCGNPDQPLVDGQYNKYLDDKLYDGQPVVQGILFVLVVACIPVLLCGKPCMQWRDHRISQRGKAGYEKLHRAGDDDDDHHHTAAAVPDTANSTDDENAPKSALPEIDAIVNKGKSRELVDDDAAATTAVAAKGDAHAAAHAAAAADDHGGHGGHGGHGHAFDLGEVFMHQVIHAIEFILGAISNTASYLRLWALSLAHAELAIVFWDRAFILNMWGGPEEHVAAAATTTTVASLTTAVANATTTTVASLTTAVANATTTMLATGVTEAAKAEHNEFTAGSAMIWAFLGFSGWLGASLGVLMVMEALSAFLHALRLHWVEFQNKFLIGTGKQQAGANLACI
jgi:V-type H+-transporting ATPase subunit a